LPIYTVQSVAFKEQKNIGGGDMHIYNLAVTDPSGQQIACELLQRPTSAAPTVGQQIDGDMQAAKNPQMPPTLKKKKQESHGGNGNGGGYNSPETIARITRSHSQDMALRFLEATGGTKIDWDLVEGDEDQRTAEITGDLGLVKKLADWFDRDVAAAEARVTAAAPPTAAAQQSPPAQAQPAPAAGGDDDIPF
jgi:hypothetical protein